MQSDNDSVFTDADEDPAPQRGEGRKRQRSMREMLHVVGGRGPKKGRQTSPPQTSGGLSGEALEQIRALIAAGNAQLREHIDRKWETLERRCEGLEHALFEERDETKELKKRLSKIEQDNQALRDQLESLDINRRLDCLILRCQDFGTREPGEDIEAKTVSVLSNKLPGLQLSGLDIQAVHRLATENTVICKFFKRQLRDAIYENRFKQNVTDPRKRLFVTESLSTQNREIMNALVQAKKHHQVYTVFSRRGLVYVKISRDAPSRRVDSMDQLERLLSEVRRRGSPPGAARAAGTSAGVAAPPPVAGGGDSEDREGRAPRGSPRVSEGGAQLAGSGTQSVGAASLPRGPVFQDRSRTEAGAIRRGGPSQEEHSRGAAVLSSSARVVGGADSLSALPAAASGGAPAGAADPAAPALGDGGRTETDHVTSQTEEV